MTPVLRAVGLRKAFGGIVVTDNVSLRLEAGARHALIGPNGAGKSSLVGLLSGSLRTDAGQILLRGRDVTTASPRARVKQGLARTFQVNSLFFGLTVTENVLLALGERHEASRRMFRPRRSTDVMTQEALTLLAELGLADCAAATVATLSYGRQRLLEITIALALKPAVLLLDEPAAGVPAADAQRLLATLERLPSDVAILMIEHDMHVVRRFAHAVTVLVEGRVLMTGPPDEVMANDEVRRVYLGAV